MVAVQDERRAHEHRDEEDPVVRAVRRDDGLDGNSKWRQELLRGLNDGRGKGGRGRWRTSRVSVQCRACERVIPHDDGRRELGGEIAPSY